MLASLPCSFAMCTLIYGGIAITGFTMFGEETQSQITLNLPKQFMASKIAIWTTVSDHKTRGFNLFCPRIESLICRKPRDLQTRKAYHIRRHSQNHDVRQSDTKRFLSLKLQFGQRGARTGPLSDICYIGISERKASTTTFREDGTRRQILLMVCGLEDRRLDSNDHAARPLFLGCRDLLCRPPFIRVRSDPNGML